MPRPCTLLADAFRLGPAAQVVWSYLYGLMFLHDVVTWMGVLGSVLIGAGAVMVNLKPRATSGPSPPASTPPSQPGEEELLPLRAGAKDSAGAEAEAEEGRAAPLGTMQVLLAEEGVAERAALREGVRDSTTAGEEAAEEGRATSLAGAGMGTGGVTLSGEERVVLRAGARDSTGAEAAEARASSRVGTGSGVGEAGVEGHSCHGTGAGGTPHAALPEGSVAVLVDDSTRPAAWDLHPNDIMQGGLERAAAQGPGAVIRLDVGHLSGLPTQPLRQEHGSSSGRQQLPDASLVAGESQGLGGEGFPRRQGQGGEASTR